MTWPERAIQLWQVLLGAAFNRQTLTYTLLADRVGVAPDLLARPLAMIAGYCAMKKLPPLTVLVVQADAGRPASGFTWASDPDFAREAVYSYAWYRMKAPAAQDFALVEGMGFNEPAA